MAFLDTIIRDNKHGAFVYISIYMYVYMYIFNMGHGFYGLAQNAAVGFEATSASDTATRAATHCNTLQHVGPIAAGGDEGSESEAKSSGTDSATATRTATQCNTLQQRAGDADSESEATSSVSHVDSADCNTHCNALYHSATRSNKDCNALQRTDVDSAASSQEGGSGRGGGGGKFLKYVKSCH